MLAPPTEAPDPANPAHVLAADALEFLRELPDQSVDLLLTDPAYESLEKHRSVGTTTRLKPWFPVFRNGRFPELLEECYRVLKPRRHFYLLCDSETMFLVKPMAELCGFKFWKPIVWDKMKIGMGYHYRSRYEFILFFERRQGGKGRQLNNRSVPDVLQHPRIHNGYPTEKPVELLKLLVEQSTEPGELVVDPFTGSGSGAEAALSLGRDFMGCDVDPEAATLAAQRAATTLRSDP